MCPHSKDFTSVESPSSTPIDTENVVPETQISQAAYKHASSLLHPSILNHSLRVYLYATALAKHCKSIYISDAAKHDLMFTACLFHDIGTTSVYNGPARFEIDGADAAVQHLSSYGVTESDQHDVWIAVACHTSSQIAERIGELSRLVRLAVITDFGSKTEVSDVLEPLRAKLESDFARLGIEKCLGDAVVEQAKSKPEKAPMASWPGVMLKAALAEPEWEGVNRAF